MKVTTIVFLVKDRKIYLARKKRGFGEGYLNGYGGKMDPLRDLSIDHTAVREAEEEGGVRIHPSKLVKKAVIDFFEEGEHLFECHIWFAYEWEGEPSETEEMEKAVAHPLEDPPFEEMWHSDRTWMPIICSGNEIKGRSFYRKGMEVQERFEYESL